MLQYCDCLTDGRWVLLFLSELSDWIFFVGRLAILPLPQVTLLLLIYVIVAEMSDFCLILILSTCAAFFRALIFLLTTLLS